MFIPMNDTMHELLNKLRVIGKLREGQKLSTNGNELYIYVDGWLSWVIRRWNQDSKDEGIRTLRDIYRSLSQSAEALINETKNHNDAKKSLAIYTIINVAVELKNSIRGLDNLSKTYIKYPTTVASLEGILRDYIIIIYKSLLSAIPNDKLPKELKESISYGGFIVYKGTEDHVIDIISDVYDKANNNVRSATNSNVRNINDEINRANGVYNDAEDDVDDTNADDTNDYNADNGN